LALREALGAERDPVECVAHDGKVFATCLRDHQALALAVEELDAEHALQGLHLMADRPLRDAQLLGGPRETLVAGGSLEGLEGIQRRQAAKHRPTS
jgi:hypothetical protein